MVAIPALGAQTAARLPNLTTPAGAGSAGGGQPPATGQARAAVALGQAARDSAVYTLAQLSPVSVWEHTTSDAVTSRMTGNAYAARLADRFDGLAGALLARFKTDGGDFSQSVVQLPAGSAASSVKASRFHGEAGNQVALTIATRSGATVALTLGSDDDRLAVQIAVTGGQLSDAERSALAGLSDAFEQAVDGLTAVPPKLALGDLLDYDSSVLASVNLHATTVVGPNATRTIDFTASDAHRSVSVTGPDGNVKVDVDMKNAGILGSASQQASAVAQYLKQFDEARQRGQGDAGLMGMFEDAFSALHTHTDHAATAPHGIVFSAGDHGMMTGLADFSASVTQVTKASNPMRSDERDAFSYQVSQQTRVGGTGQLDRSVRQHQESKLDASFHRSLFADTALMLSDSAYSQNYFYEQIHDTASSDMELAYDQGQLARATLTQSADQSRRVQRYELGRLEQDTTTPSSHTRTTDVLALVKAAISNHDARGRATSLQDALARQEEILASMHDRVLLESQAARLAA